MINSAQSGEVDARFPGFRWRYIRASTKSTRSHRQFLLLTRWRDRAGLRDQTLQFRNAGAAIGAGLQLHADLGSRSGARRDGLANRSVADPEAGADDRAGAGQ